MKLVLPLPPSLNRYYRTWRGRVLLSADGRGYKAAVALGAKVHGTRPLVGPLAVSVHVYRKQRSGDLDNILKGLLDALNGIAWEDDSQIVELHAYRGDDKANPRVELEVSPCTNVTMNCTFVQSPHADSAAPKRLRLGRHDAPVAE